jgi:hydrogenase maturation protein HypF
MSLNIQHFQIHVSGTVQGVGFRPFIYHLAREFGLLGTVKNNSSGVLIYVQGSEDDLRSFTDAIRNSAPPAARVENLEISHLSLAQYTDFRILESEVLDDAFTQVSPDLALCADCHHELEDVRDRRFDYPFINCTNCGPRFTIIQDVPYDRPSTTMKAFTLCEPCRAEYENPADRRFHAQPVACPDCGPELQFLLNGEDGWQPVSCDDPLTKAAESLKSRKIVLIQGIGGFHLACDTLDDRLMQELRRRKHRDERPFALMFPNENSLREHCEISEAELAHLLSPSAPIVLTRKRSTSLIAASVAPDNPWLGAMLPYSPLHVLLLSRYGGPLVMTSANVSDEPICYQVEDALRRMRSIADAALIHDRAIHIFADDSVMKVVGEKARLWRRARGYVPRSIQVPQAFRVATLAFGPELKNIFCLGKRNSALLSQHIGDMDNDLTVKSQETALAHFLHIFDANIELAACDLHPDYATTHLATQWSAEGGIPLVRVQHQHAHLASCLAENSITERAIGLCLDGTGYGSDGTIWGGEVLVGDFHSFERVAHLQTVPLLGGDRAAQEPWRMALAWLHEAFNEQIYELSLKFLRDLKQRFTESELKTLLNPHLRGKVFPMTSSLGRLFDAVAAVLFFGTRRQYEGQAAMLLEGRVTSSWESPYPMDITQKNGRWILSPEPMFRTLVSDIQKGIAEEVISRRFHEFIVSGFLQLCELIRESHDLKTVALSGGCFQNAFLLDSFERRLTERGFRVLSHHQVPANDGGVSLGQAVIANAQEK